MSKHSNPFVEAIEREEAERDRIRRRDELLANAAAWDKRTRDKARKWLSDYDRAGAITKFIMGLGVDIRALEEIAREKEGPLAALTRKSFAFEDAGSAFDEMGRRFSK